MKTLALMLLFCGLCVSQVVVPISAEDAAKVKRVNEQMEQAKKAWEDLQKEIGQKYLVVAKDSPDAGELEWYPEGLQFGLFSGTTISASSVLVAANNGLVHYESTSCETPEDKVKRLAAESNEAAREAKEKSEREAKMRKIHKGFDSETDFVFSEDYKFLLQKPRETPPATHGIMFTPAINTN